MAASLHLGAAILAHQGGWDEILLVLTPIVVIVVILRLAKRRVEANAGLDTGDPGEVDPDGPADDEIDEEIDDDVTRR